MMLYDMDDIFCTKFDSYAYLKKSFTINIDCRQVSLKAGIIEGRFYSRQVLL